MEEEVIKEIYNIVNIKQLFLLFILLIFFLLIELNVLLILIYYMGYIMIKSLIKIGITREDSNNTVLILLNLSKTKENIDFYKLMKEDIKELMNENSKVKVVFIRDTHLLFNLQNRWIKLLYNYNYVIRMEVIDTSENGKKIKIINSSVDFSINSKNKAIKKVKDDYEKVCKSNNKINEEDQLNGIKNYNKIVFPYLQFSIAILMPLIDEEKIFDTEDILLQLLKSNNVNSEFKIRIKMIVGIINYIKYNKIYTSKLIFSNEELLVMEKNLEVYGAYYGKTFDYYNSIAIVNFLQQKSKKVIIRNLECARKMAKIKTQKILIEFNLAFIYMYYKKYEISFSKYRRNFLEVDNLLDQESKTYINDTINEILDFINNLPFNNIDTIEIKMSKIFIGSNVKELYENAKEEFEALASDSKYLKIPEKVRIKYEDNIKNSLNKYII